MNKSESQTTVSNPLQRYAASDRLRGTKPAVRFLLAAAVLLLLCGVLCGTAAADTVEVSTWADLQTAVSEWTETSMRTVLLTEDVAITDGTNYAGIEVTGHVAIKPASADVTIDAQQHGRLFKVNSGGSLTLSGNGESTLTLTNGKCTGANINGGGVLVEAGGTLTLADGAKITKCISIRNVDNSGYAGGVDNQGTFIMTGGEITDCGDNKQTYGAGAVRNGGTFTMSGGKISNCYSQRYGGAVRNAGTFTMTGGEISGCYAEAGGAVYIDKSYTFTMEGGRISGCSATNGGAVWINTQNADFILSGGEISSCSAANGGGCVYIYNPQEEYPQCPLIGSNFTMTGGEINGCSASNGGCLYGDGYSNIYISDGEISRCRASGNGGGAYLAGSFYMSGGKISGCSASWGGGIYCQEYGAFTISGGEITGSNQGNSVYLENNDRDINSITVLKGTDQETTLNPIRTSMILSFDSLTKTGYHFAEWNTNKDGTGTRYPAGSTHTVGGTLHAILSPNTYTVTLDNRTEGSTSSTVTAVYDKPLPSVPIPEKDGCIFLGYYTHKEGTGTKYYTADGTSAKNWDLLLNTTLYAYWKEQKYTVTFCKEPGNTYKTEQITQGKTVPKPYPSPRKTGNTFSGWYTSSGTPYNFNTPVMSDTTLYAHWTETDFTITFEGIPDEGAWVYADSTLTIPVNISGAETGISAFRLIIDITCASAENPPTYETTSGGYINITEPYYEINPVTWTFAYDERNTTTPAAGTPDNRNLTRYILTHSGVSIYGKPFGNETFRIGTITLPLENRTDLAYIVLRAYTTEAYNETGTPITGDSGDIAIGVRPYPETITYCNRDTGKELEPITPLVEHKYYSNISACVHTGTDSSKNLYDASLGDTIQWTLEQAGSAQNTATLSYDANLSILENTINPSPIAGNNTGTAYLNAIITFPAPTITAPTIIQYNNNHTRLWEGWTGYCNYTYKFQTGSDLEHVYVLEIPADFSLTRDKPTTKTVRVLDYTIPDDEQLNVYMSSTQFDSAGNTYQLYYIKNPSYRVDYTIKVDGNTISRNNQIILTANGAQELTEVSADLEFSIDDYPDMSGTYRDKLTFLVDFTKTDA